MHVYNEVNGPTKKPRTTTPQPKATTRYFFPTCPRLPSSSSAMSEKSLATRSFMPGTDIHWQAGNSFRITKLVVHHVTVTNNQPCHSARDAPSRLREVQVVTILAGPVAAVLVVDPGRYAGFCISDDAWCMPSTQNDPLSLARVLESRPPAPAHTHHRSPARRGRLGSWSCLMVVSR